MKFKILFLLLFTSIFSVLLMGQTPNFDDIEDVPSTIESEDTTTSNNEGTLLDKFNLIQSKGFLVIDKQLKSLRDNFKPLPLLLIILFSFIYGIFHTLGPGHGKLIIFSYFVSENTNNWDRVALSILIPIIHSSGAILLALLLKGILSFITGFTVIAIQYAFTILSGLLIVGISLYLIFHKEGSTKTIKASNHKNMFLRNLPIAMSVGIVPCPLSLTIMSTSLIYGIAWVGFSAVAAITIAMTGVLYFIAILLPLWHLNRKQN
ncbi:MAG: hypothetical protein B6229_10535 [Spirochaetaceae bacterium 4572_7]|nr:MAG: hypothetical protein B6229_10535 [Spirochaetaceae bacterium 4572_7]